jgi:hypothetical protein
MRIHSEAGLQSLDDALAYLVRSRQVTRKAAMQKTSNPTILEKLLASS